VCVDSPLSTSSREEQTNTNTNIHYDHNASSVAHTPKALSVESIETDLKATKSPLSADANVFQPSSKLNVFAPIYDPFGNIAYCKSPQSVQSLSYWKNVLISDGIVNTSDTISEPSRNNKGLTVDTSTNFFVDPVYYPSKYTPTTPCPYFHSPNSQQSSYVSPTCNGYNNTFTEAEHFDGASWYFENAQENNLLSPFYDTPTHTDINSPFSYNEFTKDVIIEESEVESAPSPCPPLTPTPRSIVTHNGLKDPVNNSVIETKNIVSQNVRGWRSKLENIIQLMIDKDISAFCVQETWDSDDYEKIVRGFLVIHHNLSKDEWNARRTSNNGGIRRGVAIILSPEFSVAYQRAGRQKNSSSQNSIFAGRYLGISLNFPTISNYGKAVKRTTKVYIASIYHPWEEETYDAFNDYAIELLAECPDNSIKIIGHDLNASVGIKTPKTMAL
jgi:hypothetical protein